MFLAFHNKVAAQIDTLKFIDGTYYVVDTDGKLLSPRKTFSVDGEEVFVFVELPTEFPGGKNALTNWLAKNIKPDLNLTKDLTINAIFTINTKGFPTSIVAQGDTANGKGREVIKLIENMPRWKPALQGGKTVKMRLALPITFSKIEKSKK